MINDTGFTYWNYRVLRSPARNDPSSGLSQMSGGSAFESLAVRGKKECLWMFMLDRGNEYLCLSAGWILLGNWILTS